jgi:hypothetical protein
MWSNVCTKHLSKLRFANKLHNSQRLQLFIDCFQQQFTINFIFTAQTHPQEINKLACNCISPILIEMGKEYYSLYIPLVCTTSAPGTIQPGILLRRKVSGSLSVWHFKCPSTFVCAPSHLLAKQT